jgi:hypothetical protein
VSTQQDGDCSHTSKKTLTLALWSWIYTFQNCEKNKCLLFKPLSPWYFIIAFLDNHKSIKWYTYFEKVFALPFFGFSFSGRVIPFFVWCLWLWTYGLPHTCSSRCMPLHPVYWLRWGLKNSMPGLALNWNPLDLCLPSNWDYRCEISRAALKNIFL